MVQKTAIIKKVDYHTILNSKVVFDLATHMSNKIGNDVQDVLQLVDKPEEEVGLLILAIVDLLEGAMVHSGAYHSQVTDEAYVECREGIIKCAISFHDLIKEERRKEARK